MEKARVISFLDIYLTSFLSLHGIEPTLENRNGKIVFLFEANDKLYQLLNEFNSNTLVPVNDFVTRVKTMRGKMMTQKEGNGYERHFNR